MGKKNKGKYNKLGYFGKIEADKKMAKQYGIDVSEYGNTGRPGENYNNKKSYDDLKKDISSAAANDYDVRRSLEAASLSGNKKAQKIGSISNASEAYAATRFMEKTHKKRMANAGAYDGANDQGGVTNYWVNKDRDKLMEGMSAKDQQKAAKTNADEPYQESTELSDARQTVEDYDNKDFNVFNRGNATGAQDAGDGDTQRQNAAQTFLEKYKLDVKSKANFQPVL
jgi:hypothetical protein